MRPSIPLLSALAALALISGPGQAQDEPSIEAVGTSSEELIAATSTNVLGEPITFGTGTPAVSSWVLTIEPEGHTNLHQHPAPLFVYVMEGELEFRVADGETHRIEQGQAFIEPQDTTVQAFNVADGPTKVLVVAMASEDKAPSVAVTE